MAELVLSFTPLPGAELIATRFSSPRLKGTLSARLGAYDRSFKWSSGVRALSALLLQTTAWARNGRDDHPQPCLEGRRPGMAASLNDVLTSKPQWVTDVFGEAAGQPLLTELIGRWNADFNTSAAAPVRLWLECERLPPERIRVEVEGAPVDDPVALSRLAEDVRQQCERGKVAPEAAPDAATFGAGVRVDLRDRRVTVEIVLDRDYDAFTDEDEDRLIQAIRTILRTGRDIPVRGRRRGSVILSVELTEGEAEILAAEVAAGRLAEFRAVAVRVLAPSGLPAASSSRAEVPPPQPASLRAVDVGTGGSGAGEWAQLSEATLAALIVGWQTGDQGSADQLIRMAGVRMEILTRRMMRSYPIIHEMTDTNDVFNSSAVRLLTSLRKLGPPATTRDFFNLVAYHIRRELIDMARHIQNRRWVPLDTGVGSAPSEEPAAPDPGESEMWEQFHEAVGKLPAEEREMVDLVYYQGLTQREVAELLGVNELTVRMCWRSTRAKLMKMLGKHLAD